MARKLKSPTPNTPARPTDPKAAALAAAMEAARKRLGLETLKTRGRNALDFHEIGVAGLRDALAKMFEAGYAVTTGIAPTPTPTPAPDAGLTITEIVGRRGPGKWALGTVAGHTFEALVFPEHAEYASYELNRSRISKLQIRDAAGREVANFDRGWDVAPKTEDAQRITDLLAAELATRVYRM